MPADPLRSAAALIIGNEILSGKVQEQNLLVLSRALRTLGIPLCRVVVVRDHIPTIAQEVAQLASSHDVLFTSGGVGPTHDDVTIQAVALAFDTDVWLDPGIETLIREHFGEATTEGHLLMARVPRGCELVTSDSLRWPTVKMRNVWVLPGVPEVFRLKLGVVAKQLAGGVSFASRAVFTRTEEAMLIPLVRQVAERFPEVEIGSYPRWRDKDCRTMTTFDGLDSCSIEGACEMFLGLLPEGEPQKVE